MIKNGLFFLFAGVVFCCGVQSVKAQAASTEREIRAALCAIENGNYAVAQASLEKILQKEPQNIYAQRLLPGALAKMINRDASSAENTARIKRAVEAYRKFSQSPQISERDRALSEDFMITLLRLISDEEITAELLNRVEDKNRAPGSRAVSYALLAETRLRCARGVLEQSRRPTEAEIEKAQNCLSKGLEEVDRALALDDQHAEAWDHKSYLLRLAARIAAFEKNQARSDALLTESDLAAEKFKAITRRKSNELVDQPEPQADKSELELYSRELISYTFERPLDNLVREVFTPWELANLVAPVPVDEPSEPSGKTPKAVSPDKQKSAWKLFAPDGDEFAAELPGDVSVNSSESSFIYEASSEGVNFTIFSQSKSPLEPAASEAEVLNVLAWAIALPTRNLALIDTAKVFEVNLVSKESPGARPARIYAYSVEYCAGKTPGVFFVTIGKKRNYAVRIIGAGAQDARVQRFLKSFKIRSGK